MQKYDTWQYWGSKMKEMDICVLKSPTVTQLRLFFFFKDKKNCIQKRENVWGIKIRRSNMTLSSDLPRSIERNQKESRGKASNNTVSYSVKVLRSTSLKYHGEGSILLQPSWGSVNLLDKETKAHFLWTLMYFWLLLAWFICFFKAHQTWFFSWTTKPTVQLKGK